MKITKFGTVKIQEGSIGISGFEFDFEGAPIDLNDCAICALEFARDELLREEKEGFEFIDGGGNIINGVASPLL